MKPKILFAFLLAVSWCHSGRAQMSDMPNRDILEFITEETVTAPQSPVLYKYQGNYIVLTNLKDYGYDRVSITDMKGNLVLKQETTASQARMDITTLCDGVYVLVLRSSRTMKEKIVKFIIHR